MGKNGRDLFGEDISERIRHDLKSKQKKGEKLPSNATKTEINGRWKKLPESSRNIWNDKART